MSDTDNDVCPGCRQRFKEDDFVGLLPDPHSFDKNAPKRRWHLHCHQKSFQSVVTPIGVTMRRTDAPGSR